MSPQILWYYANLSHALPFFELIRSAISRSRARLGSKFCGSTAFSKDRSPSVSFSQVFSLDLVRTYVALQRGLRWL